MYDHHANKRREKIATAVVAIVTLIICLATAAYYVFWLVPYSSKVIAVSGLFAVIVLTVGHHAVKSLIEALKELRYLKP